MQWYEIIGYIVAFLLGAVLIASAVVFIKEKEYAESLVSFLIGGGIILSEFYSICYADFPAAEIKVNGYIYELQEEQPEQYITRGGHTYVLQGGEYDTNS